MKMTVVSCRFLLLYLPKRDVETCKASTSAIGSAVIRLTKRNTCHVWFYLALLLILIDLTYVELSHNLVRSWSTLPKLWLWRFKAVLLTQSSSAYILLIFDIRSLFFLLMPSLKISGECTFENNQCQWIDTSDGPSRWQRQKASNTTKPPTDHTTNTGDWIMYWFLWTHSTRMN